MRKALTWLAGLAGIAALLRRRSRRREATRLITFAPDPAVELRQKLEETRTADPVPPTVAEPAVTLDERRSRVHERAQEAIDLMHGSDDAPPG